MPMGTTAPRWYHNLPRAMAIQNRQTYTLVGVNPVHEALLSDRAIHEVLLVKEHKVSRARRIADRASQRGIPVRVVKREQLDRLAKGLPHQGVAASADPIPWFSLEEVLQDITTAPCTWLALDRIMDPQNLGAIMRSAAAFGVGHAVTTLKESAPLNATAERTSAGLINRVQQVRVPHLGRALTLLSSHGFDVLGLDGAGTPLKTSSLKRIKAQRVIVVGSEDRGLHPSTKKVCNHLLSISIDPEVESLNASVAAAIAMHLITDSTLTKGSEPAQR